MGQAIIGQAQVTFRRWGYQSAKRLMDVALCLLVLPFVFPVMVIIGLLIVLDSPGSPIFKQRRVGKDGRRFIINKFRTMRDGLDDSAHREYMCAYVNGTTKAGLEDSRRRASTRALVDGGHDETEAQKVIHKPFHESEVTRVGQFLRRTSLDELPQLFNVLKGEMALVGPRPNVPWEVETYSEWHEARLSVLPGITGLAQVRGRSCITFDHIVEYDIDYIERRGLLLDSQILWWTVGAVFTGDGTA